MRRAVHPVEAGAAGPARGTPRAPQHRYATLQALAGNRAVGTLVQRQTRPAASATLAATADTASAPMPARVVTAWLAALDAADAPAALGVVWAEMTRRGEVDESGIVAAPPTGTAVPGSSVLRVVPTGEVMNTAQLGCDATGRPTIRISCPLPVIQSRMVAPARDRAGRIEGLIVLHAALRHEWRHVRQSMARCANGEPASTGECHYCNDPDEYDAYLAEFESSHGLLTADPSNRGAYVRLLRSTWIQLFVHWQYLSPEQQRVFAARRTTVEAVVNWLFPGVDWAALPETARYQSRVCDPGGAHGTTDAQRGQCSQPIAPSTSVRPPPPPPRPAVVVATIGRLRRAVTDYAGDVALTDATVGRVLEEWRVAVLAAQSALTGQAAQQEASAELRTVYRDAVGALLDAAVRRLGGTRAEVARRHRARLLPWFTSADR